MEQLRVTLEKLHHEFEDDNYHFMAAFIEAIQHNDVESALEIHSLLLHFYEKYDQSLIDKREAIRKSLRNGQ